MPAINKIVLGTVQFGINYGINNTAGKPDQQAVNEILDAAFNAGIRCLDTAEAYGNAHEVIGDFHKSHSLQIFNIITKLPHHIDGSFDQKIEKYLQELNVARLEGLLFHSYQTYKENKASMPLLNTCKQNGMVRYIGVSVYTNEQIEDVIEDKDVDIIQLPFNLFDNVNLRGKVLKKAKDKGKIIHTRSAFLQGLFFIPLNSPIKIAQSLKKELTCIKNISEQSHLSLQKLALNYCLQQTVIDNVLIGVDNIQQLQQNTADEGYYLSDEIINEINGIFVKNADLLNPSLWKQ